MPQLSNAFDRHNRRFSSSAGAFSPASIAALKSDPNRPSSSGRAHTKQAGTTNAVSSDQYATSQKQGTLITARPALENSFETNPESLNDGVGNLNRWSSSTASSISTNHRRHSSFSRRFSLSGSTFSPGFRSMSPTKKRRSSDAQRNPPTGESSPTSLPSLNRFSPLTIPNLSFTSSKEEQNHDKPLPPRPAAAVEQPPGQHYRSDRADDLANTALKPLRDPLPRNDSYLSDIQETSRATTPTPRNPNATVNPSPMTQKHTLRSGFSRESSPIKRERQRSKDAGRSTSGSSTNQPARRPSRSAESKEKKALLSKALQRANEAVRLDNDQDYDKAAATYNDACSLLDAVMLSTKGEHDRSKLEAIRGTYLTRIKELAILKRGFFRPPGGSQTGSGSSHRHQVSITPSLDEALDREIASQRGLAAPENHNIRGSSKNAHTNHPSQKAAYSNSFSNQGSQGLSRGYGSNVSISEQATASAVATSIQMPRQMPRQSAIPPPLASKRSKQRESPPAQVIVDESDRQDGGVRPESGVMDIGNDIRTRHTSSWLNTGEELNSIPASPVSPNDPEGMMEDPRTSQPRGGYHADTEAEFDAALDAAIELAYDDGYEPWDPVEYEEELSQHKSNDPLAEQARFYAQRQAKIQRLSQRSRIQQDVMLPGELSDDEAALDSDEEDRLLAVDTEPDAAPEAITAQSGDQRVPRQSDSSASSSGRSGRTWGSSAGSSLNMTSTSLGTVDENVSLPPIDFKVLPTKVSGPMATTTTQSRPVNPTVSTELTTADADNRSRSRSPNLRERRLSAQRARQLRIETGVSPDRSANPEAEIRPTKPVPDDINHGSSDAIKRAAEDVVLIPQAKPMVTHLNGGQLSSPYPSPLVHTFPADVLTPPTPGIAAFSPQTSSEQSPQQLSPDKQHDKPIIGPLKTNLSSMSLNKQVSRTHDEVDPSPGTPASLGFPKDPQLQLERTESTLDLPLKTPIEGAFSAFPAVGPSSVKIFDNEIHSATLTGVPAPDTSRVPKPLEPCPESVPLRPWWFMRCIYQTLSHPKGGYVTTKLFVPHDVWKVKNVKLKGVEEKISNCDLLTAGLQKLSLVNTLDADAVLEEMLSFETLLETAQNNLHKKLGNEVGSAGVSALFKDAPVESSTSGSANAHSDNKGNTSSTGSRSSSRSYLNSLMKLRSKSSSTNLAGHLATKDSNKVGFTLGSVPMTSSIDSHASRAMRREQSTGSNQPDSVNIDGPLANYAGAIYKLCDAAQVLDQIARQVEDPGLRHTSPTHVGLEFSTRRAAEFFAAYVCRFIIQDLIMLEEKFVKRATEWILN